MKHHHSYIIFLFMLKASISVSQTLVPNSCDSSVMTKSEFEKCKLDSSYNQNIISLVNYISILKSEVLPKYRIQRKTIHLPNELVKKIKEIKRIYDSVLKAKLAVFETDMDKNQLYVQPKAYISFLLAFQLFKIYPDVFAILLNDIHLDLKPKTK